MSEQMTDPTFLAEQQPSFFENLKSNVIFKYLVIAILLVSIPFTAVIVQQQQETRQHASSNFQIGFNVPGITHYGNCDPTNPNCNDILRYSNVSDVDAELEEMQRMGATVIRVFAADKFISNATAATRLDAFLTKAATHNISAIVVFTSLYGDGSHNPAGTDQYYEGTAYGGLLSDQFFTDGYKHEYKDFVTTVVNANKNHANIYAWEPGNELKDDQNPQHFISFMQDISSYIKSLDPDHSISTGMIAAGHTALHPDELYPNLPNIDIITIHPYSGDRTMLPDVQWAVSNHKHAIIEEFGLTSTPDNPIDRSATILSEATYWKNQGASAFLQWGFLAKGLTDNGDGDRQFGMDTIWHCNDYNQLFSLYQTLTDTPTTTPAPLPQSCNAAPTPTPGGENTKLYIDINQSTAIVTATGTEGCSAYILDNINAQSGGGLSNCKTVGGYTCKTDTAALLNPKKDGNDCWWQYQCAVGNPGTYTMTFGVQAPNSNVLQCASSKQYTIGANIPTPTPIHCGGNIANPPQCPSGFVCDVNGFVPDTGGICVPAPTLSCQPMMCPMVMPGPGCEIVGRNQCSCGTIVCTTPQPTSTPTPIPPTPTPTVIPTPTLIPTPTFIPGGSQVAFSLFMSGISSTGGEPIHQQKQLQVQITNTQNAQVLNPTTILTFNNATRLFQGTTDLGTTLPNGTYNIKIKAPGYLRKLVTLPISLTSHASIQIPQITLTAGDINNDNILDIQDYNYLRSCYGDKQMSSSCPNPYAADLNDDGKVDGIDYNILIGGFRAQSGS